MFFYSPFIVLLTLLADLCCGDQMSHPVVYLNHGGGLRGNQFKFNGTEMAVFLGVRYAQAPVGSLRFKKPQPVQAWKGVVDAQISNYTCPQMTIDANPKAIGDEDCLYLDIAVPGGIPHGTRTKKPVMVYIHGGGYLLLSGSYFVPVALAKFAHAIVITLSYRLGALGFMTDENGKGNYGLWDQTQALIWVQENIHRFGGDPKRVTIFGESAGGGSVWAQAVSPKHAGLFSRVIGESGTVFSYWGWGQTRKERETVYQNIKQKVNCTLPSVQKCFDTMTAEQVVLVTQGPVLGADFAATFIPVPDDDFFHPSALYSDYSLSHRFDVLAGFNGQEGSAFALGLLTAFNKTSEGLTEDESRTALLPICQKLMTNRSSECLSFLWDQYGLKQATNDRERTIKLIDILGDLSFGSETLRALTAHSQGSRGTYAYLFDVLNLNSTVLGLMIPTWLKKGATHFEETPYVFGGPFVHDEDKVQFRKAGFIAGMNIWPLFMDLDPSYRELSHQMMRSWGNFAKTGNPNWPQRECGISWPPFSAQSQRVMKLGPNPEALHSFPNSERLRAIDSFIMAAYREKLLL